MEKDIIKDGRREYQAEDLSPILTQQYLLSEDQNYPRS